MKKKCVVLYYNYKPVILLEVKELEPSQVITLKKECEENFNELEKENKQSVDALKQKIEHLEKEVKFLKGED